MASTTLPVPWVATAAFPYSVGTGKFSRKCIRRLLAVLLKPAHGALIDLSLPGLLPSAEELWGEADGGAVVHRSGPAGTGTITGCGGQLPLLTRRARRAAPPLRAGRSCRRDGAVAVRLCTASFAQIKRGRIWRVSICLQCKRPWQAGPDLHGTQPPPLRPTARRTGTPGRTGSPASAVQPVCRGLDAFGNYADAQVSGQ